MLRVSTLAVTIGLLFAPSSFSAPSLSAIPLISSTVYLTVDQPGGSVGQDFGLSGSAFNSDGVHVWGFPPGFGGPVFLGMAWTGGADTNRQVDGAQFSLMVRNAPVGTYTVIIYAHDPVTNTFPTQQSLLVTVHACQWVTVPWPVMGPAGATSMPMPFCA